MSDEVKKAYPLDWPAGWKRTREGFRRHGQFCKSELRSSQDGQDSWTVKANLSVMDGLKRILEQLQRMGIQRDDIVISTNIETRLDGLPRSDRRKPSDPGVAVYWTDHTLPRGQQVRCMAVDQYLTVEDNLAAIAATLDAMRAIERHGGAEILNRAFTGFAALPERASEPWRDVLGVGGATVSRDEVEGAYRSLIKMHHPDVGGDRDRFERIVAARSQALLEIGA
jgi:hypothetical protein